MSRDYKVVCLSECLAPITHMARSEGNYQIIAREPVVTPRGVTHVPYLSGNAIRHRMVREPGFRWLSAEYGLHGKLTLQQLNFLLHGGNLTEGGGRENTRRIADFQRLFPLGRLLGGCLPDQVLAGSLQCWRGTLVCEENRSALNHLIGGHLPQERLRPAESFVSNYQYTRGDAGKDAIDLGPIDLDDVDSNLMIFSGQHVLSGASFVHGFTLPHVDIVELGGLFWSLNLWSSAGATIGGQISCGHGRLSLSVLAGDFDVVAAIDRYLDHARSVADEAIAWLEDVFSPAPYPRGRNHAEPTLADHRLPERSACWRCPPARRPPRSGTLNVPRKGQPGYKIDRSGPCPPQGEIKIPLLRRKLGPWQVGACSDPIYPECAAEYIEQFTKKIGVEYAPLLENENRLVVSTTNSWTKSYRLPLRIRQIDRVAWFAVADRRELFKTLKRVEFLGKKRSYGYGRVSRWEAIEVSRDYSWYARTKGASVLMATLPVGDWIPQDIIGGRRAFGGCVPPYWHPDRYTEIVVPC